MKEFVTTDAKFVFSKNELGYQEVLDAMPDAKEIVVITYNISERYNQLIKHIQSVGDTCKVSIITNIPSRWDDYFGDAFRKKAQNKINIYMSKLSPEKFGHMSSVFFDFSNHGKIVMTDKIVYIGSENYSEESANNTEFGFISKDASLIEYIHSEVLPEIEKDAVPYYEYDYTSLVLEANMALAAIFNAKNCLYEEVYRLHDDIDGEWYYYIDFEACLTMQTLEQICDVFRTAAEIASEIYDAIDIITDGDEDETIAANEVYENLCFKANKIEQYTTFDTLYDLALFDTNEYINQQLQEEYSMEAYEDNLESCIDLASDSAISQVMDLTQAAHADVDQLLNLIEEFKKEYSGLIYNLKRRELKKVNLQIDNT